MNDLGLWLDIGVAITAIIAAGFWFCSAAVTTPDFKLLMTFTEEDAKGNVPATTYLTRVSTLNKFAALFAGLSAVLAATSIIASLGEALK